MAIATICVKTLESTHRCESTIKANTNAGLYSPWAAAIATFFGGPFASAVIIAVNCLKLNEWLNAVMSFFVGLFATTIMLMAALSFDIHLGFIAIAGLAMAVLAKQVAQAMFSESIDDQLDAEIRLKSPWCGALIGVITLAAQISLWTVIFSMT